MSRHRASLVLCLLSWSVVACGSLWSRANVGQLKTDVEGLFEQVDTHVSFQSCSMLGTTRTGYCRFDIGNVTLDTIIEKFSLVPVAFENATIAFIDEEFEAGCGSFPLILEGSGGKLYLISGRPQSLRLSNGAAFEYLLLLLNPSSGEGCLQVSYAYG